MAAGGRRLAGANSSSACRSLWGRAVLLQVQVNGSTHTVNSKAANAPKPVLLRVKRVITLKGDQVPPPPNLNRSAEFHSRFMLTQSKSPLKPIKLIKHNRLINLRVVLIGIQYQG